MLEAAFFYLFIFYKTRENSSSFMGWLITELSQTEFESGENMRGFVNE